MMKILVDGEVVEKVNERMHGNRLAAERVVELWETKMSGAPSWWPSQGDENHRHRLRMAEKVLALEEAKFGRHPDFPPPPPMTPRTRLKEMMAF